MMRPPAIRPLAILLILVASTTGTAAAHAEPAPRVDRYYPAAAVGAPGQDVPGATDAGAVYVFPDAEGYGQLVVDEALVITRRMLGDEPSDGDRFGASVVLTGSFDRGPELVIGVPGADHGAGLVYIVHNDVATGQFDLAHPTVLRQGRDGLPGTAEAGDRFGTSLLPVYARQADAWLAIGAPGEDVQTVTDGGAVTGIPHGNDNDRAQVFYQGGLLPGRAEAGDRFGSSLAQFANAALAGAPGEDVRDVPDAGGATAFDLYGREAPRAYRQGLDGVPGAPEPGDRFGAAMVDLDSGAAIGVPGEDIGTIRDAGAIIELAGPSTIITTSFWYQGNKGIEGTAEPGDRFGTALSHGANGLVISSPLEDVRDVRDAGVIHFIPFVYRAEPPYSGAADRQIHQDIPGVPGTAATGDEFGSSVGSAADRVIIGIRGKRVAGHDDAGAMVDIEFFYDGRILDPPPRQTTQATFGLDPETGDRFGAAVTSSGSFNFA
jgi:hypothetical protein